MKIRLTALLGVVSLLFLLLPDVVLDTWLGGDRLQEQSATFGYGRHVPHIV